MKKEKELFERLDWYRGEAWSDYSNYYDNLDGEFKEKDLVKFVCKMPLARANRRDLIKSIKAPVV